MSTYNETHRKSMYKAVTWRFVATLTTGLVVLVGGRFLGVSHPGNVALASMALDVPVKLLFYYLHERAWSRFD